MKKIDLQQPGIVLFLGSMNAMPMMYARELKALGQDVVYLVDVPSSDRLSRPEHQYADIDYPYPDWIIEWILPSPLLVSMFPSLYLRLLQRRIQNIRRSQPIKAVFAGGQYIALLKLFPPSCRKIILSYGADLEWFCNPEMVEALADEFSGKSFTRYLPVACRNYVIQRTVQANVAGAESADYLMFFPPGFSEKGDLVVQRLVKLGVCYIPRLDVSFIPLQGRAQTYKPRNAVLKILCPVRFHYHDISAGAAGENKGNDLIIQALAKYYRQNPAIEIHFFEKGPDVQHAKELCQQLGLADAVIWHQQMSLAELLDLYQQADICFDQVGAHWMGAVGIYALYFGKPLIVNAANLTHLPELPVFQASNEEEIFQQLVLLSDETTAQKNHAPACEAAQKYFGPQQALSELLK